MLTTMIRRTALTSRIGRVRALTALVLAGLTLVAAAPSAALGQPADPRNPKGCWLSNPNGVSTYYSEGSELTVTDPKTGKKDKYVCKDGKWTYTPSLTHYPGGTIVRPDGSLFRMTTARGATVYGTLLGDGSIKIKIVKSAKRLHRSV